jgi:hypothetical protein
MGCSDPDTVRDAASLIERRARELVEARRRLK